MTMENETTFPASGRKKNEWLFWLTLLLPFLYIPFIWNKLPESVPTHWNFHGDPDQYASKGFGTLLLPVLNVVIYILMLLFPKIDPRKNNYNYFGNSYRNIRLALTLFMTIFFFITMQWSLGNSSVNSKTIFIFMFCLFAVLGNFMRTIRSNFFIGIRTPWTLDNPEVWKKTHEQSGKLWFYTSLAAMVISFLLSKEFMIWLLIPYFCIIVIFPLIYSYVLFRKITNINSSK